MSRTGPFFGELYLRSTSPFLDPETTRAEVSYLASRLGDGPVVDFGCGHGRHAAPLSTKLRREVVGVDFDSLSLREASGFARVCGDLHALPFRSDAAGAGYAWYSTIFGLPRAEHPSALREIHRVLRPGATFIMQTIPVERLLEQETASFDGELPDGSVLHEESRFDGASGTDHGFRRLRLTDGRVLSAAYAIAYYPLDAVRELFESTGFRVEWVHGALDGSPLSPTSRDLIVGAKKRHG